MPRRGYAPVELLDPDSGGNLGRAASKSTRRSSAERAFDGAARADPGIIATVSPAFWLNRYRPSAAGTDRRTIVTAAVLPDAEFAIRNQKVDTRWIGRRGAALLLFAGGGATGAAEVDAGQGAAVARYENRDYSGARRAFQALAMQTPEDAAVQFYLGRIALWFDEEAEALRHLEKAAALAPQSARIQNALGDAYGLAAQNAPLFAKLGWARKCRAAYERAVALEPENPNFRWSLLGFCLVAPRFAGGGLEEAEALAAEIAKRDEMSGRIARATLALARRRFEAAFAEFEAVLRERPDDFVALYHIGRCAALSGQHVERGIAALRRCLELTPPRGDGQPSHACVHYRLGNLLEKRGDSEGARREYDRALERHPDFRPAKIQLKN